MHISATVTLVVCIGINQMKMNDRENTDIIVFYYGIRYITIFMLLWALYCKWRGIYESSRKILHL